MTFRPMRVLVVDDSAVVRKMLTDALSREPGIEIVGSAADVFIARDLILKHNPDVMTLDIEMPRMDGLTFLRRVMEYKPMPVIIVSSITQKGSAASVEALQIGAIDVIAKPGGPGSVGQVAEQIAARIRALRAKPVRLTPLATTPPPAPVLARTSMKAPGSLILVGASTGGTQAIESLLSRMPADIPPMLIVQHMPAGFTKAFADRLNNSCPMRVVEAQGGEVLQQGTVYVAPGDHHMIVERFGLQLRTALRDGPPVHFQRPAVDVLFHAAAKLKGVPMVGVILTGMGADGADGLLALRQAGAQTLAEDEQSCVVFGMPKEAIARGGAMHVATLLQMPGKIAECLEKSATYAARPVAS
ncbi:MAG: chemotaxis response regulator protein-glutamate methylesterase [Vicinamibacterales bacterium]